MNLIDEWEAFKQMDDRVKFDLYMEGRLAVQKVEAIFHIDVETPATIPETADLLLEILQTDGINSDVLLQNGATEV